MRIPWKARVESLKNIFWTEWFASPLIAHKNVHIIGITHEAMTQPLQLAVELVEQDIRQQRREGAALRRPFVPAAGDPAQHHPGFVITAD